MLYDSGGTRVLRVRLPGGGSVVRKEMTGVGWERRLRHELRVLTRVAGLRGVPRLVGSGRDGDALVFEDPGGQALGGVPRDSGVPAGLRMVPLGVDEVVRLGRGLALVLSGLHGRGVVHKDVTPANVLMVGPEREPLLIDFDLATTVAEERPEFVHENQIVGTLAYLAPEQTGRSGLPVDQRADLYGLGATLYALSTGRPPFADTDPLRLVRDHLAVVPEPPDRVNAMVPPGLAAVIMRLLEKEPDRRYQSAAGVAHDLGALGRMLAAGGDGSDLALGERDFPARLLPPSRLVGRDEQTGLLEEALRDAVVGEGRWRGALVTGPAGVGKSALVDTLRPMVAAVGGWFVAGKADQFRSDGMADPVGQVSTALVRLLLAEPEDRLAGLRERVRAAVGAGAGLLAARDPRFSVLLQVEPEPIPAGDPAVVQARLFQLAAALLRAVVSRDRPLVVVLDDLHWAGQGTLGLADALLTGEPIAGLLLVGVWRPVDDQGAHPLPAMAGRWLRLSPAPMHIDLHELPTPHVAELLAEMLRLPTAQATALAPLIRARTGGNPYDTIELVNALRHDHILVPHEHGWSWDPGQITRYVGTSDVADLLAARIDNLPAPTRDLLAVLACLGGQVDPALLATATARTTSELAHDLQPALDDGLLTTTGNEWNLLDTADGPAGEPSPGQTPVPSQTAAVPQHTPTVQETGGETAGRATPQGRSTLPGRSTPPGRPTPLDLAGGQRSGSRAAAGTGSVRFRHDRVQQAAYRRLSPGDRRRLHLSLARRLARHPDPDLRILAARQYLPAVLVLTDPAERHQAVELLAAAADTIWTADIDLAERFLTTALTLLDTTPAVPGVPEGDRDRLRARLDARLHEVYYDVGRHEAADVVFERIQGRTTTPLELVDPVSVQVSSLSNRGLQREAVTLGMGLLARFGVRAPDALGQAISDGLDRLRDWVADVDLAAELRRPELTDPSDVAIARLLNRLLRPAFFIDPTLNAWLALESHRQLTEKGHSPSLLAALAAAVPAPIVIRQDCRTGYSVGATALALSEARGYETTTPWARFTYAASALHWFEPLEDCVEQAHQAREDLLKAGDSQGACFTFAASIHALAGCAANLDDLSSELDDALSFAARTGNDNSTVAWLPFRQLARCLQGRTDAPGSFTDLDFDDAEFTGSSRGSPTAAANLHVCHAIAAALLGDGEALEQHTREAMGLQPFLATFPHVVVARLLHALSLVDKIRSAGPLERTVLIAQLDVGREWVANRATEAPANFRYVMHWLEAERAWALGDHTAAALAFDRTQREPTLGRRPWQLALLTERLGRFHLERGLEHAGRRLLLEARQLYQAWGATAKVADLDREHPTLQAVARPLPSLTEGSRGASVGGSASEGGSGSSRPTLSADSIDLMAVLRASQALSSQTDLDSLRVAVKDVLSAMTGATDVRLLVWDADRQSWYLPPSGASAAGTTSVISAEDAAEHRLIPLTAIRYAERTGEPLVVDDAARDDRFSRDPYFADLRQCSLLVLPITPTNAPRCLLLLENRLGSATFTTTRLDSVTLIAGQLAVSLGNALLYASLEHKVAERTAELQHANQQLQLMSVTDPLTGLPNRRGTAKFLDTEWQHAIDQHSPLALAIIDIDHFRAYNDHYGHLTGETCLRRVATALGTKARDTDILTRFGGQEFAVVMPATPAPTARAVAEHLRRAVQALREPHTATIAGIVTVSIGVTAQTPTPRTNPRQLIEQAYQQLTRAKHAGRNQVSASDAEPGHRPGARPGAAPGG